jgi:hypothetical protein
MRYIDVRWEKSHVEHPIRIYSEIDDAGWERRKVEQFRDNTIDCASETESTSRTELSYTPIPSNADIALDLAFELREMTAEEFEQIWARAHEVS